MNTDRIFRIAVNEKGFVFDPQTGESFTVNDSGNVILKGLIAKKDQQTIAEDLVSQFDVAMSEAESDIRDFIHHLHLFEIL